MLTLTLWKFGVADLIPHGESGVSTIVGARTDGAPYPGESSLLPYSTHLARVAELPDPLTDDGIVSIVETDLAVSDRLQATLAVANRTAGPADPLLGGEESTAYAQYRAIERLYEYKFITKYQAAAFGSADTYSDWLDQSNPALGVWVRAQDAAGTADDAILAIAAIMEDAIRAKTFNFATAFGVTDIILQYVKRLILFFKAYTTDLKSFSVFMLVDAPAFETVRLMNVLAGVRASFLRADGSPMADSQRILSSWGRAGRLRLDAGLAHMVAWSLATEALEGGDWGAAAAQGLAVDAALLGDRAGPTATAAAGADWVRAGDQLADLAYLLRPSEAIAAGDSCSLASPLAPEDAVAPEDRVAGVAAALLGETGLEPQDLTAALASLTRAEHAIVTGSAQTLTRALAASPAAGLSDRLVITSASVRHDTACARTQGLGPAGTGGRGLDDAAAIL